MCTWIKFRSINKRTQIVTFYENLATVFSIGFFRHRFNIQIPSRKNISVSPIAGRYVIEKQPPTLGWQRGIATLKSLRKHIAARAGKIPTASGMEKSPLTIIFSDKHTTTTDKRAVFCQLTPAEASGRKTR